MSKVSSYFVALCASSAKVGIWWLHKGEIIALPDQLKDVSFPGSSILDASRDHNSAWRGVQRAYPELVGKQYYDIPRGRVLYDKERRLFMVYGPTLLKTDVKFQAAVRSAFSLPDKGVSFGSDTHYNAPSTANLRVWAQLVGSASGIVRYL